MTEPMDLEISITQLSTAMMETSRSVSSALPKIMEVVNLGDSIKKIQADLKLVPTTEQIKKMFDEVAETIKFYEDNHIIRARNRYLTAIRMEEFEWLKVFNF